MSSRSTVAADTMPAGIEKQARPSTAFQKAPGIESAKPTHLVILGASITALAVAREAYSIGLRPVVLDHSRGIAHWSSLVETPLFRHGSDEENLDQICALGGADACLIATADVWLRFLRRNREVLESAFRTILHPSNEALDVCLNKLAFADWCEASGLQTPRYCRADDTRCLQTISYPVLVRPADTFHSRSDIPKAAEVGSPEELHSLVERFRAAGALPLVSESLLGRRLVQYSIPFARRDSETVSFVARKERPPADWCATGTCVELSPNAEIEAMARRAVEALDYFGIGEVEILHSLDDGHGYLVEINARPWLQYALATASRHNFLGFLLGLQDCERPAPLVQGLTWLNFNDDLYVCFSRTHGIVRHGQLSLLDYIKSIMRANVYARFSWRDPRPWFVDSLTWLKSLATRP